MKQTAVEWLQIQLDRIGITKELIGHLTNEAKEMEKQQIIDSRQSGIDATINGKSISNIDYYNETFKIKQIMEQTAVLSPRQKATDY